MTAATCFVSLQRWYFGMSLIEVKASFVSGRIPAAPCSFFVASSDCRDSVPPKVGSVWCDHDVRLVGLLPYHMFAANFHWHVCGCSPFRCFRALCLALFMSNAISESMSLTRMRLRKAGVFHTANSTRRCNLMSGFLGWSLPRSVL